MLVILITLFLTEENLNWHTVKIEMLSHLILDKPTVRLFDVLRQVAIKGKGWRMCWKLLYILYFDVFALGCWRWCLLNDRQHGFI